MKLEKKPSKEELREPSNKVAISPNFQDIKFHTNDVIDPLDMDVEPEKGVANLNKYSDIIDLTARQATLNKEISNVYHQKDDMKKYIKEKDYSKDPTEMIEEKLKSVKDANDLIKNYLPYPEKVKWFFEDEETGDYVEFVTPKDLKQDMYEFEKDYLLFLKRIQDAMIDYEKISEETSKELEAINADINDIYKTLNDSVLTYVRALKENTPRDSDNYEEVMKVCKGIESGYDFSLVFETIEKYPSIPKNTIKDFKSSGKISDIGRRYGVERAKAKTSANLAIFLPRTEDMLCIEKQLLPNFYLNGTEDLFIFILIRWFAINGIRTVEAKKFHASVYNVLMRMTSDKEGDALSEDVQEDVIEKMKDLLYLHYK